MTPAVAPSCPLSSEIHFELHLKALALREAQFLQQEGDVCEVHAEKRAVSRADFHGLTN